MLDLATTRLVSLSRSYLLGLIHIIDEEYEANATSTSLQSSTYSSLAKTIATTTPSSSTGVGDYIIQGLGGQPETTSATSSSKTNDQTSILLGPPTTGGLLSINNQTLQVVTGVSVTESSLSVPPCPTAGTASSNTVCLVTSAFWSSIFGGTADVYTTCAGIPRASGPWVTGSAQEKLVHITSKAVYVSGAEFEPPHRLAKRPPTALTAVVGCDGGCALLGSWYGVSC